MIRDDTFRISDRPFAVDLSTINGEQHPRGTRWAFSGAVDALWFRRRRGDTVACTGTLRLWSHILPDMVDFSSPHTILSADFDGRYGGDTFGRWDGTGYWGSEDLEVQAEHLAVLRPMLASYPAIPEGHDGWWRFPSGRDLRSS